MWQTVRPVRALDFSSNASVVMKSCSLSSSEDLGLTFVCCGSASVAVPCSHVSLLAQLSEDLPGVSLALSLHAPNQELRQSIVPSAHAYKLDKLMAAVDKYGQHSGQKVSLPGSTLPKRNPFAVARWP